MSVTIPLTKGQFALVDDTDHERVAAMKWCAQWDKHTRTFYARGNHGGPLMHRFILGLTDPSIQCDHHNGNTLDNRRHNLRPVTQDRNRQNRGAYTNTRSGRAGVCWHKRDKKWAVYINVNGQRTHCGYFADKERAMMRRTEAELQLHGEFAFAARPCCDTTVI